MPNQLWLQTAMAPMNEVAEQAARYEADGWGGIMLFDSQSLIGDPYIALALAATATTRLGLGVGVSNPVTRHPAVTASLIASLQEASGGRAVLGIGRGNSSLAYLGAAPAPLAAFETALSFIQSYLSGQGVPVEQLLAAAGGDLKKLDPQSLGRAPEESRLQWLNPDLPKAVLEVAATGPKAIMMGVRHGDRLSMSVGAVESRIADALAVARAAAARIDRPMPPVSAYISVIPLDDRAAARRLAAPDVAMHAHIAAKDSRAVAAMTDAEKANTARIAASYDMTRHGRHGAQTEAMDDAFIDAHAIVGPPDECRARLRSLIDLGLDRIVLMMPPPHKGAAREAHDNVARYLLPAFTTG